MWATLCGPQFYGEKMYFVIARNNGLFTNQTYQNSVKWDTILSKNKGEIVEIFQNDLLEVKDFNDYFEENYLRKKKK